MNAGNKPSSMVVAQRIRNRIIEYLETASSYEEQREYERNTPIADVPSEMICQWEDYVDGKLLEWFKEPVFSLAEQAAIREFHAIWDVVASETPDRMPALSALVGTESWERLRKGAELALGVFCVRGKFDEEQDAFTH